MTEPITITAVLVAAKTALRASSTIASWTQANYSRPLTIFVGEDAVNPPTEDQAPFVVLSPGVKAYDLGTGAVTREPVIDVDFAVLDSSISKTDSDTTITHTGLIKADVFGSLIRACLQSAFGDDAFRECNYALDAQLAFPLIEGGMTITLTKETGLNFEPTL